MAHDTKQERAWSGQFGRTYTDRNPGDFEEMEKLYVNLYGVGRSALNEKFLGSLDRSIRILEVGSNVGSQLAGLQQMGFTELYGIELQKYAVEKSKGLTQDINLIQGNAFDVPFKDGFFDLVFTSGVLIHIGPADIGLALDEIWRCSRAFIWGFEYFAAAYTTVAYRGNENLLWKADFARLYMDRFDDLKLVKEERFKYVANDNEDAMFLLEKSGTDSPGL